MGSRERKRAERQKRKQRAAQREAAAPDPYAEAAGGDGGEPSFPERMAARSEERNEAVRAQLEPLAEGERPGAVTVGAGISALVAAIFTVSAVVAGVTDIEVNGEEPSPFPLAVFAGVVWMMTWGLWKARYWAVLGLQMLLVLTMVSAALGLVSVSTFPQLIGSLLLLGGSGTLFYKLIRAMARIQMPERPGAQR